MLESTVIILILHWNIKMLVNIWLNHISYLSPLIFSFAIFTLILLFNSKYETPFLDLKMQVSYHGTHWKMDGPTHLWQWFFSMAPNASFELTNPLREDRFWKLCKAFRDSHCRWPSILGKMSSSLEALLILTRYHLKEFLSI